MSIPLAIGSYLTNRERAINCYPVRRTDLATGRSYIAMLGTEGLELLTTISGQPVRGLYAPSKDETALYAVLGTKFYKILSNGTAIEKGTLLSSQGMVEITDNGDSGAAGTGIFITDGQYAYGYQPTTDTFAQITDADFPGATCCTFLDGYIVVVEPLTQKAWSSGLYDFTAWEALDFSSAESDPDDLLKAVRTPAGQLAMFGRTSTEFWYNAGLSAFPFARIQGARFGYGLAAMNGIAINDQSFMFLARTTMPQGERVIVRVDGYNPTIISPEGLNRELASLSTISDCEAFAYMREGHSFGVFTFPADGRTFVVDAMTGKWHERQSTVSSVDTRWRARGYAYFNGWHVVGDYSTGNLYKMKSSVYAENGTTIKRKIITPTWRDQRGNRKIMIPELVVPVKSGVGLDGTGQGTDPLLMLRYSKDGGNTWSNEKTASVGKIGEYTKQPTFLRMGQGYQWNFEISYSEPTEFEIDGPLITPDGRR